MVISNYAFSELSPKLQTAYMENVLKKSKHGFIIYNPLGREKYRKGYTALEIAYSIPESCIYPLSETSDGKAFWHEICIVSW